MSSGWILQHRLLRRVDLIQVAFALVIVVGVGVACPHSLCANGKPGGVASEKTQRSMWYLHKGKRVFLLGTNYPWYNGYRSLDFGRLTGDRTIKSVATINGRDLQQPPKPIKPGVTGFDAVGIEAQLADMEGMHMHALRWFWGGDGRSFMNFDASGNCLGISEETMENVDKALALAEKHHIYVIPVLLDFRFIGGDKFVRYEDGKPAPTFAYVIKDPEKRRRLIENFVKPLAARYAKSDAILYWEIMNECGNVVRGSDPITGMDFKPDEKSLPARRVSPVEMQSFLNECYDAIKKVDRKHSVMASGLARPFQLPLIVGRVRTDLYGAHYNDNGSDYAVIQSVSQINDELEKFKVSIDKPLIMTEGTASIRKHLREYVLAAYEGGWAGILPWQYHQTVGLNDFIRYKRPMTSMDGNPASSENIEFYKEFWRDHKADLQLD